MGFEARAELIVSYEATPGIVRALLAGISVGQAGQRPDPESLALVEVVAHLADAEVRAHERVRRMLSEPDPQLAAYDEAVLASEQRYVEQSLATARDRFAQERAAHVATLRALSEDEWGRIGRHAEVGSITIETYTAHMVAHDLIHLAQIARLLTMS